MFNSRTFLIRVALFLLLSALPARGFSERRVRFNALLPKKQDIKNLCAEIDKDGRLESFHEILSDALRIGDDDAESDLNAEEDEESEQNLPPVCTSCESFLKLFLYTCLPQIHGEGGKRKKEEPTPENSDTTEPTPVPTPTPIPILAREPSAAVLTLAGGLFHDFGHQEALPEQRAEAAKAFLDALEEPAGKNQAEYDYFTFLSTYVRAALPVEILNATPSVDTEASPTPTPDVGKLFE